MSFVGLDIGASGTRYVSESGKIMIMPNNMVYVDLEANVDMEPFNEEVESALDITIEANHETNFLPKRVLVGSMANRHSSTNIRPSVIANKHTQEINYISMVSAAAVSALKQNIDNPNITLYVALPPVEAKVAKEHLKEQMVGEFNVTFNKLGRTINLHITDVVCFEESFLAMLSYFFNMNGSMKDSSKKYASGNILSLDIGASTTDLVVTTDMRYIEKSGQTYKTGGNVARDILIDSIRGVYGFDLPSELADVAMAEGRMQMGNKYVDISKMVINAKKQFAASVVEQIQTYFRKINIPIQSIRAIIVSGGGSMKSEYIDPEGNTVVTSEAMSYYITESLNKICEGIEVESHSDNPRLANISGLFIRAQVDRMKKAAKAG